MAASQDFCLFIWGANSYGQLGLGHTDDTLCPAKCVLGSSVATLCQVTGGGGHSVLLTDEGQIYVFGWNKNGQLGLPPSPDVTSPCLLPGLPRVTKVSCGWNHTLALCEGGWIFVWGSNNFGQLGSPDVQQQTQGPVTIAQEFFEGSGVVDIAAGLRHSLAVTADGRVFSWGNGKKGQLGYGSAELNNQKIPKHVRFPSGVVCTRVSAGAFHSTAIAVGGQLFCWGANQYGQCAVGHVTSELRDRLSGAVAVSESNWACSVYRPIPVEGLPVGGVARVSCGWSHVVALAVSGRVYSWGRADYGQLGLGQLASQDPPSNRPDNQSACCCQPQVVPNLGETKQVECGSEHSVVLSESGQVLTFGWNEHGMCGTGDEKNVPIPFQVVGLNDWEPVLVGAGAGHSFILARTKI